MNTIIQLEETQMKYLEERSLFYYFLMREITDEETDVWAVVADLFGVRPEQIELYRGVLADPILDELETDDDIEMYRIYTAGYFCEAPYFGERACERNVMDAKSLAVRKAQEIFDGTQGRGNRLRVLSHTYDRDHVASVVYALKLIGSNTSTCPGLAEEILEKEFRAGRNSDAGLVLLRLKGENAAETAAVLKDLPDMLLRPEMQKYLTEKYGSDVTIKARRTIGF